MNRLLINNNRRHKLQTIRAAIIFLFNARCSRCGFSDIRALQIDHINGGGNKERDFNKIDSTSYYMGILKKLLVGSTEYRLLCANCNWIKKAENHEIGS